MILISLSSIATDLSYYSPNEFPEGYSFLEGLVFDIFTVICAIGLLCLKNWARMLTFVLVVYSFYNDIVYHIVIFNKHIDQILSLGSLGSAFSQKIVQIYVITCMCIEALVLIFVIFYFTRPKVKEQFK